MLTLEYCEERTLLDKLHEEIFGGKCSESFGVVLRADGVPCGLALYRLQEGAVRLEKVGVLRGERGKGYGDFFTRALIFKFMQSGSDIVAPCVCDYYKKLGFTQDGGEMRVAPEKVVFPSACHREGNK